MPANAEVRALLRATWVMLGLLGRPGLPGAVLEGHNTVGVLREHARIAARRLMGLYPPWGHSAEGTHAVRPGELRMLSPPWVTSSSAECTASGYMQTHMHMLPVHAGGLQHVHSAASMPGLRACLRAAVHPGGSAREQGEDPGGHGGSRAGGPRQQWHPPLMAA